MLNQVVELGSEVNVTLEVYTKDSEPFQHLWQIQLQRTLAFEGLFPEIMGAKMCLIMNSEYWANNLNKS